MERREGWECSLNEFLFKRKNSSFRYGRNDCCLFVADAVEQMTGVDPADGFRGRYKTKAGAYDLLFEFAGGDIGPAVKKLTRNYGMPEVDINHAGRGDIVIVATPRGDALGIVDMTGEQVAVPGRKGLIFYPTIAIKQAWRVG